MNTTADAADAEARGEAALPHDLQHTNIDLAISSQKVSGAER